MAPSTPTAISRAAGTNRTSDELILAMPQSIVVQELLWVINTLHNRCYHRYLLLPPVPYYLPTGQYLCCCWPSNMSMAAVLRKLLCGHVYHFTIPCIQPPIFECMVLICGALRENDIDVKNHIICHCQYFLPPYRLPPFSSPCSTCKDAFWLIVVLLSGRHPPLLLCTTQLPFAPVSGSLVLPALLYLALPLIQMLPQLLPLPPVPHVALLLLWLSPVTPTLLPYAISSLVCSRQLDQVLPAWASILYNIYKTKIH